MKTPKNILKRTISVITILMLIITTAYAGGSVTTSAAWTGSTATSFAGGYGTKASPYLIATPEQLAYLATLINNNNSSYNTRYYELTEDIDLGGREWTPIGKGVLATDLTASSINAFKGVFNGNGHTISNFKITSANTSYLGLFGNLYGSTASIANLNVSDFTINASMTGAYNLAAGGVAGTCYGLISSCGTSNGTINIKTTATTTANCYAGGLVGRNQGGVITKSYARTDVATTTSGTGCHSYAGGLVGHVTTGNVTYCYSTGNANSTSEGATSAAYAGGFTAANQGTITSSYANGTAYSLSKNSTAIAAGFVALNTSSITTSYATGNVTSVSSTKSGYGGGFVGNINSGSITSCFATGNVNVSGVSNRYAGGFAGNGSGTIAYSYGTSSQTVTPAPATVLGKITVAENLTKRTFFTSTSYFTTIWNFTDEWTLGATSGYEYPTLISVPHPATWAGGMATAFSGGNGTIGAPYEIATAGELALLANNVNSGNTYQGTYFKLTSNIDLQGLEWIPIGRGRLTAGEPNASNAFCGSFDGGNHTVSNFTITTANTAYTGLFGIVYGGSISNLKVKDFVINVTTPTGCLSTVGAIAGTNTGVINGCYASGSITGGGSQTAAYIGGLVGRNESGLVSGSISEVTVVSNTTVDNCHAFAGGLVGYNNVGTITTSYSTGETTAHSLGAKSAAYAGGITAMSMPDSTIMDSYSNSNVTSTSGKSTAITGGIVGHNHGSVSNSYSTGNINCAPTASGYGGGFVGNNSSTGNIKSCFSVSNVTISSGTNKYAGNFAGTSSGTLTNCYYTSTQSVSPAPATTPGSSTSANNLTKQVFYTSTTNFATPWNMSTIWTIGKVSGYSYPTLINTTGEAEPEPQPPVDDDPNIDPDGWDGTAAEEFAGGRGTQAAPYEIATPGQLLLLANEVNDGNSDYNDKYYILTDNINLNHRSWAVIGKGTTTLSKENAFLGNFDGNGYIIENLKIKKAPNGSAGLFGNAFDGEIKNVILNNVTVDLTNSSDANLRIGAVAGYTESTITDCYVSGTMTIVNHGSNSNTYAGGITGFVTGNSVISGCVSEIKIDVTSTLHKAYTGGIVGFTEDAALIKNAAKGNITSKASNTAYAGGVTAYIEDECPVTYCYASGNITAESENDSAYAGGLAGYNNGSSWNESYASGEITASTADNDAFAGGLFGHSAGILTSCFAVNNVNSLSTSGTGYAGGLMGRYGSNSALNNCYRSNEQEIDGDSMVARGQSTVHANLKSKDFLTDTAYFIAPWDFETVWQFKPATGYEYPIHKGAVSAGGTSLDVWEGEVATSFDGGSGTNARPYKIANAAQLAYLAYMVNTGNDYSNSSFELTADIDLSESVWVPIGKGVNTTDAPKADKAFCGRFNGNGRTISNMTVNMTDKSGYGLFGCVYNASITNLNVDNVTIDITAPKSANVYAGGIAGISYGSEISFARTTGSVKVTSSGTGNVYTGGIAGANYEGVIEIAYSAADINATGKGSGESCMSGGITGYTTYGEINDCYYAGSDVKAITMGNVKAYAGGIAGYINEDTSVTIGYSTGNVTASSYVTDSYAGGIVGQTNASTVQSMLSIGNVTATAQSGNAYSGGIIGKNNSASVTKCYKNNQQTVTGDSISADGTALSADYFKDSSFLTDTRRFTSTWDFDTIWEVGKATDYAYPTLQDVAHITTGSSDVPEDETGSFEISYVDGEIVITANVAVNKPLIIITAYNGNKMTNTEIFNQNLLQGENLILTTTFTTTGADRIKIMIWDAADTQSQLTTAKEIKL